MQDESKIRWTVTVSRETDVTLRSFLAQRGLKKGDISKFIEDAVKWRVLDQTITEARAKFADMAQDDVQALVNEATQAVRQEMRQEFMNGVQKA